MKLAAGLANKTWKWLVPPFDNIVATSTQKGYLGE
jgi:hypothetical protein